jgi:hypothetical protein
MDQYFVSLTVKYEPDATIVQRSIGWLAHELVRAGLTLTEDTTDVRRWTGVLDAETYARVALAWRLEDVRRVHILDAMKFEAGRGSPVVWVSLTVSELDPITRELAHAAD